MKILKNKLVYFILGLFFIWYIFPVIPIAEFLLFVEKFFDNSAGNIMFSVVLAGLMIISTGISLFVQFGAVLFASKLKMDRKKLFIVFFSSIIGLLFCVVWTEHYLAVKMPHIFKDPSYIKHIIGIVQNLGASMFQKLPQRGVINFFIISLCFSFGSLLSFIVKEKKLLVPVMLCCALIDFWTCTMGFTHQVMSKVPEAVSAVSTGVPMLGGMGINVATIGPGDFIFVSLVYAVVLRFDLNIKRTFWFIFGLMYVAMLLIVFGLLPFVPALICVCIGTLLANMGLFDFDKSEKISMAVVFSLLFAVLVVLRLLKIG